jgi:hypothetical protein
MIMLHKTMLPSQTQTSILTGYYSNIEAVEVGQGRGYRVSDSRQPARTHLGWLETILRPAVSVEKAKGIYSHSMSLREPTYLAGSSSIVVGGNSSGMLGSNSSSSVYSSIYPSQVAGGSQQLGQQPSAKLALGWLRSGWGVGHTPLLSVVAVASSPSQPLDTTYKGGYESPRPSYPIGVPKPTPHRLPVGGMGGSTCCIHVTSSLASLTDRKERVGMMRDKLVSQILEIFSQNIGGLK